ncbi:hypothetical protein ETH_00039775 [Eimeria tenella]|uniref:Uncharacterized protein n=1 Tax=Eimeria tenella TaxID=5802 RepID=U6KQQ1_EIMTE|nr:hypothetical protein ETH_00039775 [Eimeria tenella]CDJ39258.1 hypothetical protein ETH_00039775 [Eimeria tenella]|eukprot:XP_013230013.1 hypothetical protein ETH_00039775 [Eimeria tenella]
MRMLRLLLQGAQMGGAGEGYCPLEAPERGFLLLSSCCCCCCSPRLPKGLGLLPVPRYFPLPLRALKPVGGPLPLVEVVGDKWKQAQEQLLLAAHQGPLEALAEQLQRCQEESAAAAERRLQQEQQQQQQQQEDDDEDDPWEATREVERQRERLLEKLAAQLAAVQQQVTQQTRLLVVDALLLQQAAAAAPECKGSLGPDENRQPNGWDEGPPEDPTFCPWVGDPQQQQLLLLQQQQQRPFLQQLRLSLALVHLPWTEETQEIVREGRRLRLVGLRVGAPPQQQQQQQQQQRGAAGAAAAATAAGSAGNAAAAAAAAAARTLLELESRRRHRAAAGQYVSLPRLYSTVR